ncbi:MAG: hypothetical protein LUH02_10620 [Erysipelotrichaceae bacterium]|nr:hypothetical protein [Erysipelotrichaceae bacterium]
MEHQKGNNAHGNSNELNIVEYLDDKNYKDLNLNMKNFISYIADKETIKIDKNTKISSRYETNNKLKQDLYIILEDKSFGISIKMGEGNSTHQEKVEDFIDYITTNYNDTTEALCDAIRFFVWCDGTLDGSGSTEIVYDDKNKPHVISRITTTEFKRDYPKIINRIQYFLKVHERDLLEHYLLRGNYNSQVDYIYHGTEIEGQWTSSAALIDYQIEHSKIDESNNKALLSIGRMNVQVWNRALSGSKSSEKKRGQIQLKYPNMSEDLTKIMVNEMGNKGTFIGDMEEYDISKVMNRYKNHKNWKVFDLNDNKDVYVVRVDKKIFSHLSEKKVNPKSDAYLIRARILKEFLLEKEYLIKETDLDCIDYKPINGTGISVKERKSRNFTYQKLTRNSFVKVFSRYVENTLYVFAGLLLYSDSKQMYKNEKILNDLNVDINDFCRYTKKFGLINFDLLNSEHVDFLRKTLQDFIKNTIETHTELKESLFLGKNYFDEPYCVNYILKNGSLTTEVYSDYKITTGSGRSKGNYTIIIKPA